MSNETTPPDGEELYPKDINGPKNDTLLPISEATVSQIISAINDEGAFTLEAIGENLMGKEENYVYTKLLLNAKHDDGIMGGRKRYFYFSGLKLGYYIMRMAMMNSTANLPQPNENDWNNMINHKKELIEKQRKIRQEKSPEDLHVGNVVETTLAFADMTDIEMSNGARILVLDNSDRQMQRLVGELTELYEKSHYGKTAIIERIDGVLDFYFLLRQALDRESSDGNHDD